MTDYESALIGYALLKQDALPLLRLKGKFSEARLNQLASIASEGVFDLLHIIERIEHFRIAITSLELVHAMNTSPILDTSLEAYIAKIEEAYVIKQSEHIINQSFKKPLTAELIADIIQNLSSVNNIQTENPNVDKAILEFQDIQEKYVISYDTGKNIIGYSTGIADLDKITDGLQKHHLWVLAAYTSIGKTTFALNLARELLKQDVSVVFYSLEMARPELYAKLLALESGLGTWKLKRSGAHQEDYAIFQKSREISKKWKLKIYDKKNDIDDIILSIKAESLRGAQVIVIDYLQNISDKKARNEYELITNAIHDIQNTTLALPISTILVSQISNEDYKQTSVLSVNAKGSGGVRAASDVFIFLKNTLKEDALLEKYRTNENIPMQLIISKNRHGRIGSVNIERAQETGLIYEMPSL